MTRWNEATFVFISTNPTHEPGGVEDRWLDVMTELASRGASVRFLCLMGSPAGERARGLGIGVDPYILDRWNLLRSRSRLRKYLERYRPVCAHSVGLEADLLLRAAAPKLPGTRVATTLPCDPQGTRRRSPIDALMRRFDERGIRASSAVFAECEEIAAEVRAAGVPADRVVLDVASDDPGVRRASVERHLAVYETMLAQRDR